MFYSTLTLRYDPGSSAFDDAPLAEFSRSREILSVREHFFVQGELPHLLLCISWRMPPAGTARSPTAKQEGKPAYAILTNRMAAEVAVLPSPTLSALGKVSNLGPARVTKYGAAILEVLGVVESADG